MISLRRFSLIAICIFLIFMVVWHTEQVDKSADIIISKIEDIEKDMTFDKIDKLIELWGDHSRLLSCTFEHDYLDDITRNIYSLRSLYMQDADSIYSTLYEIKWSVENMRDMQRISWGNIF